MVLRTMLGIQFSTSKHLSCYNNEEFFCFSRTFSLSYSVEFKRKHARLGKDVTCLREENSSGRSVKVLFFRSTVLREVIFPIIGGTFRKFLLQMLRDLGFPLVAFNKILSAILYPC